MTVTGGNGSDLEPVVNEDETEETPVSEIPYPEGTAPPVLNDAVHADIQFTLVEAVLKFLEDGGMPEESIKALRAKTATEIINTLMHTDGGLAVSLYEAMANGGGGGEQEVDPVSVFTEYYIALVDEDEDGQKILKYGFPIKYCKYAVMGMRVYPLYQFKTEDDVEYILLMNTSYGGYIFEAASVSYDGAVGRSVDVGFHKYFESNQTIPANGSVLVSSSTGIFVSVSQDDFEVTDAAVTLPFATAFRSGVEMNTYASVYATKTGCKCFITNTSSSAVSKSTGDQMENGRLAPLYLYE